METNTSSTEVRRRRSKTDILRDALGGVWKYDECTTWWDIASRDGRHVTRSAGCSCDVICDHQPRYQLYERRDATPRDVVFAFDGLSYYDELEPILPDTAARSGARTRAHRSVPRRIPVPVGTGSWRTPTTTNNPDEGGGGARDDRGARPPSSSLEDED